MANNEMLEACKSPVLKIILPLSFIGADDGYLKKNHREWTMSALGTGEQDAVIGITQSQRSGNCLVHWERLERLWYNIHILFFTLVFCAFRISK